MVTAVTGLLLSRSPIVKCTAVEAYKTLSLMDYILSFLRFHIYFIMHYYINILEKMQLSGYAHESHMIYLVRRNFLCTRGENNFLVFYFSL